MADMSSSPPSQKLSRYRSQRKPSTQVTAEEIPVPSPPALPQDDTAQEDGVSRSKSRYRRRPSNGGMRPATANDQDHTTLTRQPSNRVSPAKQGYQQPVRPQSQRQSGGGRDDGKRNDSPHAHLDVSNERRIRSQEIDWEGEEERRRRLKERYSVQRQLDESASPAISTFPASQTPTGELFPPPRPEAVKPASNPVLLDGPPTSDQIRATKSMSALPTFDDSDDDPVGCFGLFKRKRGDAVPQGEKQALARLNDSRDPQTIRPGGGGVVPGTDAPVSAVNAGDRRVMVECGKSQRYFAVTPSTTSVDIIKMAAVCLPERIVAKSAVLLESFGSVGIQRPLRRYEHVRDVMNSWDSDDQNILVLVDPNTGSSEVELSLAGVPLQKPGEESWFLSFSQKVGKWDKRLVTLKSDGLITAQKDPKKPKDIVNVCHLSDFDIYTPTPLHMRKKIKPPKKICYAIKSQQKTSMFENTHDFVHFFCTNDKATAEDFYASVQAWRSWYLVNVMGEGKKQKPARGSGGEKEFESGGLQEKKSHRPEKSFESNYQLGSFKPLLDMDQFEKRPVTSRSQEEQPTSLIAPFSKSSNQFNTTISPERRISTAKRKQPPPGSMGNKAQLAEDEPLVNIGRRGSVNKRRPSLDQTKAKSDDFLSTGLLGRSYSQRQRDTTEREDKQSSPFTNGSNLLSGGYEDKEEESSGRRSLDGVPRRTHSTRAQHAHKTTGSGDLMRSNSRTRDMPKPLVDLTPQYREPPQHVKKGKAYNPDAVGSGGLIDAATSPEDPLGIPSSTDWRGRNAQTSVNRSNSLSRNKPNTQSTRRPATSREYNGGFTGEGLLAGSQGQSGWGGGERGRGVMDGSRAKGPMVDLTETSRFVNGSLLRTAERDGAPSAPVIDRSREEDSTAW